MRKNGSKIAKQKKNRTKLGKKQGRNWSNCFIKKGKKRKQKRKNKTKKDVKKKEKKWEIGATTREKKGKKIGNK